MSATLTAPQPAEGTVEAPESQVGRNVLATIAARVLYMATRMMIPPFVLSYIGLEAYGLWTTAFILVSYLGLTNLGISIVYIRYSAQYAAQRQYERLNELASTGLAIAVPVSVILFGSLVWFWPQVARLWDLPPDRTSESAEAVLIVAGVFLTSMCLSVFGDILVGLQKISVNQKIWVVAFLVETVLIVILVGGGRGIRGMAEAFLVRSLVGDLLEALYVRRHYPWFRIGFRYISRDAFRQLISFGSLVQVQSLLGITLASAERIAALLFVGTGAAAVLDLAKKWPGAVSALPTAFITALMPRATELHHRGWSGVEDEIRDLYLRGSRHMNLVSGYFCAFMAMAAGPIFQVWLKRPIEHGALLFALFSITMQIHLLTGPATSILRGIGRASEEFYYAIPNLVFVCLFVPVSRLVLGEWTTAGVGIAVCAGTWASVPVILIRAKKVLGINWRSYAKQVLVPGLVPYAVAIAFAWPAVALVPTVERWAGALLLAGLGAAYTAALGFVVARFLLCETEKKEAAVLVRRAAGPYLRFLPAGSFAGLSK